MPCKKIGRFELHPFYEMNEEDYKTRQISLMVGSEKVAVINSNKHSGTWSEPSFVILKGPLTYAEMCWLCAGTNQARGLMMILNSLETALSDIEPQIEKINEKIIQLYDALTKNDE